MHISKCELLESVFFGNYEWVPYGVRGWMNRNEDLESSNRLGRDMAA